MLLQKSEKMISPYPERIVWLYKRWQPLYDDIRRTVHPQVEFIKGIPLDLEQDSFIHPGIRNLVILADLMSTSAKDPRINELFTEGSHHRNLSIIAINQNLYFNKDPTQRRNCHYLVIFKNPNRSTTSHEFSASDVPRKAASFVASFPSSDSETLWIFSDRSKAYNTRFIAPAYECF